MSIIRGDMGTGGVPDDSQMTPVGAILFFPVLFTTIYSITKLQDSWHCLLVLPAAALSIFAILWVESCCLSLIKNWSKK